jgi:type VI secretion system secreted protein VgrG
MPLLELSFASSESSLSVRRFLVEEGLSRLYRIIVEARSPRDDVGFESIVGFGASFSISHSPLQSRVWSGLCSSMELVRVEPSGLSTYELTLVPELFRLSQRTNRRLFQHRRIPDIIDALLAEWRITPTWLIDRGAHPRLELRTQYGESDYAFFSRLLEEAGITFHFEHDVAQGTRLVLSDRPHEADPREGPPIPFTDEPGQAQAAGLEYLSAVRLRQEIRPGRRRVRDFDFRRPAYPLFGEAAAPVAAEQAYEQYDYSPGAFLIEAEPGALLAEAGGAPTPAADDQGIARFAEGHGAALAAKRLAAERASRRVVSFGTSVITLAPGTVFKMSGHPRPDLSVEASLLVSELSLSGTFGGEWTTSGKALFAGEPYLPPRLTPRPTLAGQQSAVVVGPPGEEIHTDEFGRVRVQFHWDRQGKLDEHSSTWMRVSQGWAGPGQGLFALPRVGHEVLVSFLEGDIDSPYVSGRLFNATEQVPHKLPDNKTVSTWKTSSSPSNGGFNELRFDDAAGREHVYLQAERDHDRLVKNDEMSAVGNNLTRLVQNDEAIAVGKDRAKVVHKNELEVTGLNRAATVGVNRTTTVGADDATVVGSKFSVTMARGLTARLASEIGALVDGPLGAVVGAPIATVLGLVPQTALGGKAGLATLARGPLSLVSSLLPASFRSVLGLAEGHLDEPGPPPTSIEMVDRKITFTTGEASIVLEGPNITLSAQGNVVLHAGNNSAVLADGEAVLAAGKKVLVLSRGDDLVLQGGPHLHLNPFATRRGAEAEPARHPIKEAHEIVPDAVCEHCGAPMIQIQGDEAPMCSRVLGGRRG